MDNMKFNSSDSSTFHNQIVYKRATSYIKGNELNFIEKQKKNDNNKIEKKEDRKHLFKCSTSHKYTDSLQQ